MSDIVERAKQKVSLSALPEELLERLFFELPTKTLLRCKSVCREWRAHISNRDFWARRYKHIMQIRQPVTWMFTFYWEDGKNVIKLVSIHDDRELTVEEKSLGLPKRNGLRNQPIGTVMHCKGVLAVCFIPTYMMLMYNPAKNTCKTIQPRPPQEDIGFKSVAFGFDHRTENFKYVILANLTGTSHYFFEVYSQGTQMWQRIEATIEVTDAYTSWNDGVLDDGIFYWIVPGKQIPQKLLLFNMSSNSVSHLILPDGLQKPEEIEKKLMQWNNSLAIIFYSSIFSFEVWILTGPTLTRHATIELSKSFYSVVFWKPSEILLQDTEGRLWSYDFHNKVFRTIPMKPNIELFHATCFSKSLVTV